MRQFYKFLRLSFQYGAGIPLAFWALALAFDVGLAKIKIFVLLIAPYVLTLPTLFIGLAALLFWFTYVEIRHRHTPLTVVSGEVTLTLATPKGDDATLTRKQRIRANREDVTGYQRNFAVDPPGQIPFKEIAFDIGHCDAKDQRKVVIAQAPDLSRWELMHSFDVPIPRNLFMLGLNTVERTETIVQRNAYTRDEESFEMRIPDHYRVKRFNISVHFHPERVCQITDCQAFVISANGVIKLLLNHIPPHGIMLKIRRPSPGERYRIIWKYPPMSPLTGSRLDTNPAAERTSGTSG
jgi:hypothetical protein